VDASAVAVRDAENSLSAQSATTEAFSSGPQLVAYIVVAEDAKLIAADLREYLRARLPDYMIPSHFVKIATLPMTAHGKLDKAALPASSTDNLLANRVAVAPVATPKVPTQPGVPVVGPEQSQISAMVASLLGQPMVSSDENFFMIGGHSMLGVQLVAQIREMFGVKLTLLQLFSAPTVAALSAEVVRLQSATR
jgi:acyl carrier protein